MYALTTRRVARQSRSLPLAIAIAIVVVVLVPLILIGSNSGSIATTATLTTAPARSETSTDQTAGAGGSGFAVTISGFALGPASTTVEVGDMVTWTNMDSTAHTVTALDGSFDSGPLAPGARVRLHFPEGGDVHLPMHPASIRPWRRHRSCGDRQWRLVSWGRCTPISRRSPQQQAQFGRRPLKILSYHRRSPESTSSRIEEWSHWTG